MWLSHLAALFCSLASLSKQIGSNDANNTLQVHVAADDNTCDVGIQHVPVLVGTAVVLQAVVAPKSSRPNQDQRDPQCARIYVVEPVAVQNVALVLASSQVVSDTDCQMESFPVDLVDGSHDQLVAD